MKKLFSFLLVIVCTVTLIGTTQFSVNNEPRVEVGAYFAAEHLPVDADAALTAASIQMGATGGSFVGKRVGMAIGWFCGPLGAIGGYVVGGYVGSWVGAF